MLIGGGQEVHLACKRPAPVVLRGSVVTVLRLTWSDLETSIMVGQSDKVPKVVLLVAVVAASY